MKGGPDRVSFSLDLPYHRQDSRPKLLIVSLNHFTPLFMLYYLCVHLHEIAAYLAYSPRVSGRFVRRSIYRECATHRCEFNVFSLFDFYFFESQNSILLIRFQFTCLRCLSKFLSREVLACFGHLPEILWYVKAQLKVST